MYSSEVSHLTKKRNLEPKKKNQKKKDFRRRHIKINRVFSGSLMGPTTERLARLRTQFLRDVADPQHLMRELRKFMRANPRSDFPVQLASDAREVAIGRKPLLVQGLDGSSDGTFFLVLFSI